MHLDWEQLDYLLAHDAIHDDGDDDGESGDGGDGDGEEDGEMARGRAGASYGAGAPLSGGRVSAAPAGDASVEWSLEEVMAVASASTDDEEEECHADGLGELRTAGAGSAGGGTPPSELAHVRSLVRQLSSTLSGQLKRPASRLCSSGSSGSAGCSTTVSTTDDDTALADGADGHGGNGTFDSADEFWLSDDEHDEEYGEYGVRGGDGPPLKRVRRREVLSQLATVDKMLERMLEPPPSLPHRSGNEIGGPRYVALARQRRTLHVVAERCERLLEMVGSSSSSSSSSHSPPAWHGIRGDRSRVRQIY